MPFVLVQESEGAFLVRDSSDPSKYLLSLSFKSTERVLHTRIQHDNGIFFFYHQPKHDGYGSIPGSWEVAGAMFWVLSMRCLTFDDRGSVLLSAYTSWCPPYLIKVPRLLKQQQEATSIFFVFNSSDRTLHGGFVDRKRVLLSTGFDQSLHAHG